MAGEVDGALKETEAAVKIFEREEQPQRALAALMLATETAWQARKVEETTRWAPRGIEAARNAGDAENLRHLLSLAATLANFRGEYEKANEYLEEAAKLAPGLKEADAQEDIPRGGRLVVAIANPVQAREPINMELVEDAEILTNVFETLLATDQDGNLVPGLCERWEVANEGKSFVLTLRDNIRFQDGHPLTAEDVKQSFEQAIRHASQELPAALSAIHGVREYTEQQSSDLVGMVVHSKNRLEIHLDEALSIYPALLADYKTGITRASSENNQAGGLSTGTGPFRLASYESGRITLECNQEYWKGAPAALDAIEFRHGLSAAAIASGVRSGEIDLAIGEFPLLVPGIRRQKLFSGRHMSIFQKDHPRLGNEPSPGEFMEEQHVFVTAAGTGHPHQIAERSLEEQLPARNIIAHVPSFTAAAILAKHTEAVATMPGPVATVLARELDMQLAKTPVKLPEFEIAQYWHERFDRDPGNQWLRSIIYAQFGSGRKISAPK